MSPKTMLHAKGLAMNDLDFAALLVSRVCHDLVSPVGAVVNGLEVLEDETDAAMPSEERGDLYRALRHAGWLASIDRKRVEAQCPTCGLEDGHGLG